MSLKEMLLMFLDDKRNPVHGGEIERYAMSQNFKASNGTRRARELVEEGKLKAIYKLNENTGHSEVWYEKTHSPEIKEKVRSNF